jgi:hypothetical protein
VLVDPVTRRVFAACVAKPSDPGFEEACEEAFQAIQAEGTMAAFSPQEASHQRGDFPQVTCGVAYGMGRTKVMNIKTDAHNHRDSLNLPFGWCAVQALGRFDYTKGGHLVLPDLRLIIEFPAGSLILLPSATLLHANTPVQIGEARASFTQYTPGGNFRYAENGFRSETEILQQDKEEYKAMQKKKKMRWENGLKMWSTLDDLKAGVRKAPDLPPS